MVKPAAADEILTVRTLSAYLHCHPATVYRLLKERRLPAFRIGGRWRFRRSEIDQWIARQTPGVITPQS